MTESSTIEAPTTLSQDTLDRLAELRRQRRAITHEIKEILGSVIADIVARPTVECLRCGFVWTPHSPAIRPRACARCVTTAWDKPPTPTSRKPSDSPSPSWRVRSTTARRRPRMQPEPKRIVHRRTKEEIAADKALTATVTTSDVALAHSSFVPPRISALLPPPPTPSHVPSITLSAWLRDVAVEDGKSEPQPERVSSHLAPPPEPSEPAPVENPVESPKTTIHLTAEEVAGIAQGLADVAAGRVTPLEEVEKSLLDDIDVPPEQIGLPQTDAEREELARAKEEVWPTTRSDD